jgi:hypothetical protein
MSQRSLRHFANGQEYMYTLEFVSFSHEIQPHKVDTFFKQFKTADWFSVRI